jgi:hypothetical protein
MKDEDGVAPLPGEPAAVYEQFVQYVLLGPSRTLPAMAFKLGHNIRSVERVAAHYRWRARAAQVDYARARARVAQGGEQ